jgi:hypothetical protein
MEGQPLLGVLRGLILDGEEQASYNADPSGYMQRAGYDDMSADDLGEAVSLVADTLPPDVAHAVTTAAATPEGAEGDGAAGILDRLASIDADDVPPLDVPPPVELAPDEVEDADAYAGDDATAFGDTDLDDGLDEPGADGAAGDAGDEPADRAEGGRDDDTDDTDADGADGAGPGDTYDTGDDMDADALSGGFDPFAEEAAEPSLAEAEAGGPIDFRDAADVDDDPIDFGEEGVVPDFGSGAEGLDAPPPGMEAGLAAAPAPPEAGDEEGFGADDFGADATLEGEGTLADDPFAEDAYGDPYDGDAAAQPDEGELDLDDGGDLGFDQGFDE